ncbi:hypothetical protein BJ875DRAFT_475012 [Amylocarpus encephaloides]|uniref:Uncharacterized protein n=1 Tax=Amylocarpus encephaloides TaxID=45428 RepID=A0A9P7YAE3_9HELO|nr:hypothetical protein BJ875DRAFT_475012 [Amylocarpus encephaloides]
MAASPLLLLFKFNRTTVLSFRYMPLRSSTLDHRTGASIAWISTSRGLSTEAWGKYHCQERASVLSEGRQFEDARSVLRG